MEFFHYSRYFYLSRFKPHSEQVFFTEEESFFFTLTGQRMLAAMSQFSYLLPVGGCIDLFTYQKNANLRQITSLRAECIDH